MAGYRRLVRAIALAAAVAATGTAAEAGDVLNVRLREGTLRGVTTPGAEVCLATLGGETVRVRAGEDGQFAFTGRSADVARVSDGRGSRVVRMWPAQAPPRATAGVDLRTPEEVVRGQSVCPPACSCGRCGGPDCRTPGQRCLAHARGAAGTAKWFVITGIAAVAIIELAEDDPKVTGTDFAPVSP